MENKFKYNKIIIYSIVILVIFIIMNIYVSYNEYIRYNENYNYKILQIVNEVLEKYPDVNKNDIIEILNNKNIINENIFSVYGININEEAVITSNAIYFKRYLLLKIVILIILFILYLYIIYKYNKQQQNNIKNIINYIQEINKMNYKLDIQDNSEGEMSILKNELYKITIMLKESAENSKMDKLKLKDSLADISHQLKTPLTSIIIMLDNIIENKNMDENIKNEFIKNIKREIINVKFLIEAILKLSKLDSNTIEFIKRKVKIEDIINESIKNVEILCDLKNIKIDVCGNVKENIICDLKWQVEAITNILKNAVEASNENSIIIIKYEKNKLYSEIQIQDLGRGIDKQDLKHIFKRFYKGKDSKSESVGIGLSLAKLIIEKDNGQISVNSETGKGTKFIIKYFN